MNSKPINLLKSEYKLLGKIGSGGFSFVYLVENIAKSGDLCAAKFQVLQTLNNINSNLVWFNLINKFHVQQCQAQNTFKI